MSTPRRTRRGSAWTAAERKLLGKLPDSVLARQSRRTIKEVRAERERRRIGLPTPPNRWTAREIRLLGRFNDAELARRLHRPHHEVRKVRISFKIPPFKAAAKTRPWTVAEIKLLGTLPDAELARRFGRTELAVANQRFKLVIPKSDPKIRPHRPWITPEIELLGR